LQRRRVFRGMNAAIDLVDEARQGGPSLERLITEIWPQAYKFALAVLHDRGLAEDATQEACAAIARGLPALKASAMFPAWSYKIVVNRALTAARKRSPAQPLESAADAPTTFDLSGALDMRDALAKLAPRQRAILVLHYYAGFRAAEIAEAVGVPPATVRFHLMTARRALHDVLTGTHRAHHISKEALTDAR
jgi:RNA polymerase sigma-70 factor (ECF subfamily)